MHAVGFVTDSGFFCGRKRCTDSERPKHVESRRRKIQVIGTFQSSELNELGTPAHAWQDIQNPGAKGGKLTLMNILSLFFLICPTKCY